MSTSSTPIPTPISLETVTLCTFGTAAAAAATETITTTSWYLNETSYEVIHVAEVIVRIVDAFVDDCRSYLFCEVTAYPNPDISGRGVSCPRATLESSLMSYTGAHGLSGVRIFSSSSHIMGVLVRSFAQGSRAHS